MAKHSSPACALVCTYAMQAPFLHTMKYCLTHLHSQICQCFSASLKSGFAFGFGSDIVQPFGQDFAIANKNGHCLAPS